MALKLWISTDGNWDTAGSWLPSTKPAAGDDILFSVDAGGANLAPTTGNDQTVTNFSSIVVEESFTKDLFASGSPLKCTADVIVYKGGGTFYFQDEDNLSGVTDSTDIMVCDSQFDSKDAIVLSGNEVKRLVVQSGGVSLSGITSVGSGFIIPSLSRRSRGRARITIGTGSLGTLFMTGGVFESLTNLAAGAPTTIYQFGGEIVSSPNMTGNSRFIFGGIHNLGRGQGASAEFDDLFVLGGTYDYSELQAAAPRTATGHVVLGSNGTFRRRPGQTDPTHNTSGEDAILGKIELT